MIEKQFFPEILTKILSLLVQVWVPVDIKFQVFVEILVLTHLCAEGKKTCDVEQSSAVMKTAIGRQVVGRHRVVHPKITWRKVVERDMDDWGISQTFTIVT